MQLHQQAEIYWRQRGSLNWTLKGDTMTAYFFAIANDRRRRCFIDSLIIDGVRSSDQGTILNHIVAFFSSLLSAKPDQGFRLSPNFWDQGILVSSEENTDLMIPYSKEEIFSSISNSNPNSASGPDVFSTPFFNFFLPILKELICAVIQSYCLGTLDISRLNYAVISLIPKTKGADLISQFRPIALINNFAKFPTKCLATRLTPVAHRTLSPTQSAFVKGCFILDGVLCLHEIIHDIHKSGSKAVILKLDFEKAYDSVSWGFLKQVLLAKGFDSGMVHRIMQLVMGGAILPLMSMGKLVISLRTLEASGNATRPRPSSLTLWRMLFLISYPEPRRPDTSLLLAHTSFWRVLLTSNMLMTRLLWSN